MRMWRGILRLTEIVFVTSLEFHAVNPHEIKTSRMQHVFHARRLIQWRVARRSYEGPSFLTVGNGFLYLTLWLGWLLFIKILLSQAGRSKFLSTLFYISNRIILSCCSAYRIVISGKAVGGFPVRGGYLLRWPVIRSACLAWLLSWP